MYRALVSVVILYPQSWNNEIFHIFRKPKNNYFLWRFLESVYMCVYVGVYMVCICWWLTARFTTRVTLTHSFPKHLFSTPWKHQKTYRFFYAFSGQRKGALETNGLIKFSNLVFRISGLTQMNMTNILSNLLNSLF